MQLHQGDLTAMLNWRRGQANREGALMLEGVKVVELAIWVAGPAAAGILCDWGAEVIKVEPPSGDPMRTMFTAIGLRQTRVPPFELDNRGKRSVVLNLRTDDGIAEMHRLIDAADVFVTNLRPDALERLGLDHVTVRATRPRLIYCSITGYGLDGPDRDRAGYDVGAFWARSGLAATHVPEGADPIALRPAFGDHMTGMAAATGILAALYERERSGQGHLVHTSLLRVGAYGMGWDIGNQLAFGKVARTRSRTDSQTPLVNAYRAADGKTFWLLGVEQDRHWPGLLRATERADLATDERFATATLRVTHAAALIAEFDAVFASREYSEWTERFDAHDVWWAPINTLADVVDDPQVAAAGAFVDMHVAAGETPYRAVASPVSFDDRVERPGPVPALGSG